MMKGDLNKGGAKKQEGHLVAAEICTGGYKEIYCSSIFNDTEPYKFTARREDREVESSESSAPYHMIK